MIVTVTLNPAQDKYYILDNLQPGESIRVRENYNEAGGKGINVAKVARLLGENASATGFLGGHTGAFVREFIAERGLADHFVRTAVPTRMCVNIVDTTAHTQTQLLEQGDAVSGTELDELRRKYEALLQKADVAVLSGSVPEGVGVSFYPELIAEAKRQGKKVLLDTSGELLKAGIAAHPDLIKPNADEVRELLGDALETNEQIIAAAQRLQRDGIGTVVVSMGKDGAVFVCGEGVFRGFAPKVDVVNTVGCGDSMVAAFAVGMSRSETAEQTIRSAMAVSAANAMTREAGSFEPRDYQELLGRVNVQKLA